MGTVRGWPDLRPVVVNSRVGSGPMFPPSRPPVRR